MDPERQPQRVPRGLPRAILFLPGGILLSILVSWVFLFVWPLPSPAAFPLAESTRILDRYGRPLYEIPVLDQGSHTHVPLVQISMALRQATIASEDASFYSNPGVDLAAVARALVQNLAGRGVVSGGSTITQQLARELYFTPQERTSR
ncbi:MAG TPA: biosynthetic peptidoglycan transglycosylase, partial [Dehalococcoidia bacterium]|nr:biosynthetic peptidoglycan transglycosylase [Dehalococcoidia bacterium]